MCKGKSIIQGNPLYMEARVKSECLIQRRGASNSEPFEGIKYTCENIKTIGGNQQQQNNQRGQGKNYQKPSIKPKEPKQPKRQDLCRPKWTWVLSFCCVCMCSFSRWWLMAFTLASLAVLFVLVAPMVFDVCKLLHCMFKLLPGNN